LEPWRKTIKEAAPWAIQAVQLCRRATNQVRYPVVASALELQAGGRIMSGPFRGMRAPHSGIAPGRYAQILGVYEQSLTPVIESVIARQPPVIIDVGSHWGYYALGLAMRCPRSRIVAYEMDRARAGLLRRFEQLNGLDGRVELRGACGTEDLATDLAGLTDPFLIMDVEGAEDVLLDPVRVPGLERAEIVVELHEHFVPGVTERLRAAFAATHREAILLEETGSIEGAMTGWVVEHPMFRRTVNRLMDEGRSVTMSWLHLTPIAGGVQNGHMAAK